MKLLDELNQFNGLNEVHWQAHTRSFNSVE